MTPAAGAAEPLPPAVRGLADDLRTARQTASLGRVVAALQGLSACRGAVLVDSFANGRADRVSDPVSAVGPSQGARCRSAGVRPDCGGPRRRTLPGARPAPPGTTPAVCPRLRR